MNFSCSMALPTKYTDTGQHSNRSDFARPGSIAAWDRYADVRNNPLRYTDPSGHDICDELGFCYDKKGSYRINGQLSEVASELTSIAIYNDTHYSGSVALNKKGQHIYDLYLRFVRTEEWLKWALNPYQDPLLIFLWITLGREAYPEIINADSHGKELFLQVSVGWYEIWTLKTQGSINTFLDRRMTIFAWMGNNLQSANWTLEGSRNPLNKFRSSTNAYTYSIAYSVYHGIGRNPALEQGSGWWPCWGNRSLFYDEEVKPGTDDFLKANNIGVYGEGNSLFLFDADQAKLLDEWKKQ